MTVTQHWVVAVVPMIFNDRITLSSIDDWRLFVVAGWCYDKGGAAGLAAAVYDPEVQRAPVGYKKIAGDQRFRLWTCPKCGKSAYEPRDDCHDF